MSSGSCRGDNCDPKPSPKEYSPAQFYKFHWQKNPEVSPNFLIYRWVTTIFIVGYAIVSIFEQDPLLEPTLFYPNYFIYLTNWVLWMCAIQAILATWIVHYYQKNSKDVAGSENEGIRKLAKLYKVSNTIAVVTSITVTLVFWYALFDPYIDDTITIFTCTSHGVIAALVLLDALIVAHPFTLSDFYYVFIFSVTYAAFSFVYYHLGGTNRYGETFIYPILDWEEPVCAFRTTVLVVLLQLFNHLVVWQIASFVKGG
ncbi:hypothetical protein WDU94_002104 [Cyamophila willieti]